MEGAAHAEALLQAIEDFEGAKGEWDTEAQLAAGLGSLSRFYSHFVQEKQALQARLDLGVGDFL